MTSIAINELVASMIRLHGIKRAVKLADSYATDCATNADARGYDKWSSVAARIAELLDLERRFGKGRAA
jgi:hypothetical protein